jgi:uncharacterized membrane protein YebE (DUF533 family)
MKIQRVRAMVAIAYVDGYFDVEELKLLNSKAASLGISEGELIEILQDPYSEEPIDLVSISEKKIFLRDLMTMIYADGIVDEREMTLFDKYLSRFQMPDPQAFKSAFERLAQAEYDLKVLTDKNNLPDV